MPIGALLPQASLPWPGTMETCPKCRVECQIHYLHASRPGVSVVCGKRVVCPVCAGQGTVSTPLGNTAEPDRCGHAVAAATLNLGYTVALEVADDNETYTNRPRLN